MPTASAAATDLTATAKQDFGWRNLAWTVTSAKPVRDADILHVAANDWGSWWAVPVAVGSSA